MARTNIKFTSNYKIYCNDIDETTTPTGRLPFKEDSSCTVQCSELVESDSVTSITCTASKALTCYRIDESGILDATETVQDPETYIKTFTPNITYSDSVGFKITNLNTLLTATNTSIDYWEVRYINIPPS